MTPEEIASRAVKVHRHPERDEWWITLEAPSGAAGIQLGAPSNDQGLLEAYAEMLRGVVAQLARDVMSDCVEAARELESRSPAARIADALEERLLGSRGR
jgi:hypothetical protein